MVLENISINLPPGKIESPVSPGAENNYIRGMLKLNDSDFRKAYLKSMERYNDYWENGKTPQCSRCHTDIETPKDLRKYAGQVLHPKCFREKVEKAREGEMDSLLKTYWERVANLMTD